MTDINDLLKDKIKAARKQASEEKKLIEAQKEAERKAKFEQELPAKLEKLWTTVLELYVRKLTADANDHRYSESVIEEFGLDVAKKSVNLVWSHSFVFAEVKTEHAFADLKFYVNRTKLEMDIIDAEVARSLAEAQKRIELRESALALLSDEQKEALGL